MDFQIKRAAEADVPGIMRIMEEAGDNPEHPDWFAADDEAYIRRQLEQEGFVITAVTPEGEIAGFFAVSYPGPEKQLGELLGYTKEELSRTAVMDSAAVGKQYRGMGLQRRMLKAAEKELPRERFAYLLCTVHPENTYSLSNMQSQGYRIRGKALCYGGLPRYILEKRRI